MTQIQKNQRVSKENEAILRQLQSRFATIDSQISLADELIAERRAEAASE